MSGSSMALANFDVIVPTIENLQQLEAIITESEEEPSVIRNSIKALIGAVPTMIFSGKNAMNFHTEQDSINTVINLVNSTTENTKDAIQKGLEYQQNHCGTWDKIWAKCSGCPPPNEMLEKIKNDEMMNLDKLRTDYLNGIHKIGNEMANGMLRTCCVSTFFLVLTEGIRLFIIWGHIKNAENCILDSEKKSKIEQNLFQVLKDFEHLTELKEDFVQGNKTNDEMEIVLDNIEDILDELRDVLMETRELIGQAKIEINGKKETLLGDDQQLLISMGGNFAQLALNTFQFAVGFGAASMFWKVATSAALLTHVGVIGAQAYTRSVTKETIKECRKAYRELELLDKQVTGNFAEYKKVKRWQKDASKKLRLNKQ